MANNNEIERRRTFAIIAHPDAGKTSLTEKLLLFGGQIQVAGAVKSNKIKKTATRATGLKAVLNPLPDEQPPRQRPERRD